MLDSRIPDFSPTLCAEADLLGHFSDPPREVPPVRKFAFRRSLTPGCIPHRTLVDGVVTPFPPSGASVVQKSSYSAHGISLPPSPPFGLHIMARPGARHSHAQICDATPESRYPNWCRLGLISLRSATASRQTRGFKFHFSRCDAQFTSCP